MNIEELKFLLKKYSLTPNKIRGQNFLISDEVLDDILATAKVNKKDLILEVGAGLGALTQRLLPLAKQVRALEVDKNFKKPLDKLLELNKNLEIIWQDVLSFDDRQIAEWLSKQQSSQYKIVANIPYYLTSKFLQKFLTSAKSPQTMTLMVQKEVAQRVVDDKKNSLLSLAVAFYAKAKLARVVSKENFYPSPKIDSAILYIYDIKPWSYAVDEKKTWQLIKRGFAYKRKKLFNNLLSDASLEKDDLKRVFDKIGINLNIRAEKLSVDDWLKLSKNIF